MVESIMQGQVAVVPDKQCELCDINDIVWKCLNCDELICDPCKMTHLKSKVARYHKVEPVKGADKRHNINDKNNIRCNMHPTEDAGMYCKRCELQLCRNCIVIGSHQNHPIVKFEDMIRDKFKELSGIFISSREKLKKYEETIKSVKKNKSDFSEDISRRIEEVKTRNMKLKNKLDEITSDYIEQLELKNKEVGKIMENLEQVLNEEFSDLKSQIQHDESKKIDGKLELVTFVANVKERLDKYKPCDQPEPIRPPFFVAKDLDQEDIKTMFGVFDNNAGSQIHKSSQRIQKVDPQKMPSPTTNVKVISTFTMVDTNLVASNDTDAWVGMYGQRNLTLVTNTGNRIKTVKTHFEVFDLAVTNTSELLITLYEGSEVKKVKKSIFNTGCVTFSKFPEGHVTQGITVANNNDIIVCLYKECDSKLLRLSTSGQLLNTIQYDTNSKIPLFHNPYRISSNRNGDLIVVDNNRVVVIDEIGHRRFVYKGQVTGMKKTFDPQCSVTDQLGHILISDYSNSVIHKLDKDGHFQQFILTGKHNLEGPVGLSLDKAGRMWVCDYCNDKIMVVEYM